MSTIPGIEGGESRPWSRLCWTWNIKSEGGWQGWLNWPVIIKNMQLKCSILQLVHGEPWSWSKVDWKFGWSPILQLHCGFLNFCIYVKCKMFFILCLFNPEVGNYVCHSYISCQFLNLASTQPQTTILIWIWINSDWFHNF